MTENLNSYTKIVDLPFPGYGPAKLKPTLDIIYILTKICLLSIMMSFKRKECLKQARVGGHKWTSPSLS